MKLLLIFLLVAGCTCDAVVVDLLPDGGLSEERCAQECVTTADCPPGLRCPRHPLDPKGVCLP